MTKRTAGIGSETHLTLIALSDTPMQIARIVRGSNDRALHRKPAPDAWSARDIVAHLRACGEVWGRSIDRMITEDHPTIRYVSPRGWIKRTDYLEQSCRDSLREFSKTRAGLVATLSALDANGWSRRATLVEPRWGATQPCSTARGASPITRWDTWINCDGRSGYEPPATSTAPPRATGKDILVELARTPEE